MSNSAVSTRLNSEAMGYRSHFVVGEYEVRRGRGDGTNLERIEYVP